MPEDLNQLYRLYAADQADNDGREKAPGPGGGEPDEWKLGAFRRWLEHHRLVARNFAMQRRVPSSIGLSFGCLPGGRGVHVHIVFNWLVAPEKNEDGENQKGDPRLENLALGVRGAGGERRLRGIHGPRGCSRGHGPSSHGWLGIFGKAPDALGLPEEEKNYGAKEREEPGGDVHQIAVHVVGPEKLHRCEGDSDHEDGRQDLERFLPGDHGASQPERYDDRGVG